MADSCKSTSYREQEDKKSILTHQHCLNQSNCAKDEVPEGGWGWVVVFVAFFNLFVFNGLFGSFSPKIDVYSQTFDVPKAWIVWIPSIMNGVCFLTGPLTSALLKKFRFSLVTFIGGLISTCAIFCTIFSKDFLLVILFEGVLAGFGLTLLYIPSFVSIGYYFNKKMPIAIAIAVSGSSLGPFAFAPLVNILLEEYGWKGTNMILAAITFNSCWLAGLLKPLKTNGSASPCTRKSDSNHSNFLSTCKRCQADEAVTCTICISGQPIAEPYKNTNSILSSIVDLFDLDLFRNWNFIVILLAEMGALHIYYAFYVFLPLAAMAKGFDNYSAVFLVTLMGGSNAIGRAVLCLVSYTLNLNEVALFSVSLCLTGLCSVLPTFDGSYPMYAATAVGCGFFSASLLSLTTIILKRYFGAEGVASSYGLISLLSSFSVFTGASVLEWISDCLDPNASFLYAGVFQFASGILLSLLILRDRNQNASK